MRLEFNPRSFCYNLYCDTREEQQKMTQMMKKQLTSTNLKSIDSMIYADTDSVKEMKTKLNSIYGRTVMMNNNYFVIHESDRPVIIFKEHVTAIRQLEDKKAEIQTTSGFLFIADEDYVTVVKLMF